MNQDPSDPPAGAPSPAGRPGRKAVTLALVAAAALAGAAYWFYLRPKSAGPPAPAAEAPLPPDPRLAYVGPFHNVQPGIDYVGDAKCAECHPDIARTYAQHPMGRSLVPAAALAGRHPTDPGHHNPFESFGIRFSVDEQGGRVLHRQTVLDTDGKPVYEFAHPVDYAIGSGARGHSYLTVREGFVFQTPISWFGQKQLWDLSPGFSPALRTGRMIPGECLYCHANRVEPVADTLNRFHEPVFRGQAIGCERCHGPGELHARTAARDDIVDPKRLEPALREAVCQQCHLEGDARVLRPGRGLNDFRPGMPLDDFWAVFVRAAPAGEPARAVGHVEQMSESLCYRRSPADRKLGCTSCHNPHEAVAPENRVAYYRGRCLQCHAPPATQCAVPEGIRRATRADDSCIACHMPRAATADIVHTAATDHRVVRRPGAEPTDRPARPPTAWPLADFFRPELDPADVGRGRDFAVGVYHAVAQGRPILTDALGEFALGLLDRAVTACPADLEAREAKGLILATMGRLAPAATAYEGVLARAPRREEALAALGATYRAQGRAADAAGAWRRAVAVNPWAARYRKGLVVQLADLGEWDELRPHLQRWLDLDPASVEARCQWVECLLRDGRTADAVAEYGKVRLLKPPDLPARDAWFGKRLRQPGPGGGSPPTAPGPPRP